MRSPASTGRWAALIALAVLAVTNVVASGRVPRVVPASWLVAAVLLLVAADSALWSVDRRLTVERIFTVGVVFVAAAALALAPGAERTLDGLLAGAALVGVASLLALVFAHNHAVLSATAGAGWRFQGLGENPNSIAMLFGVLLPVGLWRVLTWSGRRRVASVAIVALLVGELAVTGSRGALVAAVAGTIVTAVACVRTWRARGLAIVAVGVLAAGCIVIAKLPQPVSAQPAPAAAGPAPVKTRGIDAQQVLRLEDEIGAPPNGEYRPAVHRTIFGSSGRAQAWSGAVEQGKQRPLVGYGFGTEGNVFVDRYNAFESGLTENGYLGLFLQVGIVGLGVFLLLLATLLWSGVRVLRSPSRAGPGAAATGVLVAAMLVEMSQTGFLSVGNITAAAIWFAVLPLPLLARERA